MKKIRYILMLMIMFCMSIGFAFTVKAEDTVTLPVTIDEDWGLAASLVNYINEQRTADRRPYPV